MRADCRGDPMWSPEVEHIDGRKAAYCRQAIAATASRRGGPVRPPLGERPAQKNVHVVSQIVSGIMWLF